MNIICNVCQIISEETIYFKILRLLMFVSNWLTAGGVLSPWVDLDIDRLAGTDICFNGPAQKIITSRHTNIKHAVTEIWCWIHFIMAEAEGPVGCLNNFTLSSGRSIIVALWAGGATSITAGVVSRNLPGCPKIIWSGDWCSIWGEELIT